MHRTAPNGRFRLWIKNMCYRFRLWIKNVLPYNATIVTNFQKTVIYKSRYIFSFVSDIILRPIQLNSQLKLDSVHTTRAA